jgi:flagellar basal-body rod modification protein FlgD
MNVGATSDAGAVAALASKNSFSDLSSEEFLKIIFTELTNQDPMKPQDTGALMEQIQSLRQIESDLEMQDTLGNLADTTLKSTEALSDLQTGFGAVMTQSQIASAGSMIGRDVSGMAADGAYIDGTVESVRISGEEISLLLESGDAVPLGNLIRVR